MNTRTELRNAEVAAYNASRNAFLIEYGETRLIQSAYLETRRELGPLTAFVSRAIEIYDFESRTDLVLLMAREMGRALGLDLSTVPGSVMSGTASRDEPPALHPSDVAALRALCPGP
jgi:hypothetical protein